MMKKFRFHFNVDRETRRIDAIIECASCGQEVQTNSEPPYVKFLCPTHGESFAMRMERFQALYMEAESKVAAAEKFEGASKMGFDFIPADPSKMS